MEVKEKQKIFFSLFYPTVFVLLLWIIKSVEYFFDLSFAEFGISPREFKGLRGIVFSPLLHGSFSHLFNNTIPLLILGSSLFYFYRTLAFKVVLWSWVVAGLYTWISARSNYHIGASGLVYSLFGFLLISGFLRKNSSLIGISFLVAFLYGSLIWGILPWDHKISWEGHLWGLFIGLVLAIFYRNKGPRPKKYSWDYEEEEEENEASGDRLNNNFTVEQNYYYTFKPKDKEE